MFKKEMNLGKDIFLVFDSLIDMRKISLPVCKTSKLKVYIFPLTSKSSIVKEVANKFKRYGYLVQVLPSAAIINSRDKDVRDRYIKFVSDFPEKVCRAGKDLKKIFRVEKDLSLWWLSLIAEKNVYKSDSFNCLVQMESIVSEIFRREISEIIFSGRSRKLKKALSEVSEKNNIEFKSLPAKGKALPIELISEKVPLLIKHVFAMTCRAVLMVLRTFNVKKSFVFSSRKRKRSKADALLTIITPYPVFDEILARKGVFENKYFIHLQEALEKGNKQIAWISMYVRNRSVSFNESLRYAGSFLENGTAFFMLEEFNSFAGCIKAFWKMLASGTKFILLKRKIREASSFGNFNIYSLFEDDWYSSFVGSVGYYGLVSYYTFKNMLKTLNPKKCLYSCEMRAWEKALLAARDAAGSETFLFAYQAGTVSTMHLNFYNHSDELKQTDNYCLPKADKILCNGCRPYESMLGSGWPKEKIAVTEALRYTYLKKILEQDLSSLKRKVIILLLSIGQEESSSILSVSYEAFKDMEDVEVWIKPHPFLNLDKTFRMAGIDDKPSKFKIKEGPLKDFLPSAKIAVTGESSAAVEALAFGCRVLIVDVPEWINLSPLRFVDTEIVDTVSSSEELKQAAVDIFSRLDLDSRVRGNDKEELGDDKEELGNDKEELGNGKEGYDEEKRRVVNEFFCFNKETDVPERFLEVLRK